MVGEMSGGGCRRVCNNSLARLFLTKQKIENGRISRQSLVKNHLVKTFQVIILLIIFALNNLKCLLVSNEKMELCLDMTKLIILWYDKFGENHSPLRRNGMTAIPKK